MKKTWLALLILAGCSSAPKKLEHPFYYEVSKGAKVGHLFGTMHVEITPEELPDQVLAAVDQADVLAVESNREFDQAIAKRYLNKPHKRLDEILTPVELEGARSWLEYGLGNKKAEVILKTAKPIQLMMVLAAIRFRTDHWQEAWDDQLQGRSTMLDVAFEKRSNQIGHSVSYLDSRRDSERAVDCLMKPDEEIAAEIRKILVGEDVASENRGKIKKLAAVYRAGDMDSLGNDPGLREAEVGGKNLDCMLRQRNEHWIPEIETLFQAYDKPFIAVGALHVEYGPSSLQKLLEAKGFRVNRVDLSHP